MKYNDRILAIRKERYIRQLDRLVKKHGLKHPLVLHASRRLDTVIVEMQKRGTKCYNSQKEDL